jgi:hypothetical protein
MGWRDQHSATGDAATEGQRPRERQVLDAVQAAQL